MEGCRFHKSGKPCALGEIYIYKKGIGPWGCCVLERYLLIRVSLTQPILAWVSIVYQLFHCLSPTATCRSTGKCDRKTLSLLPLAHIHARWTTTERYPPKNNCTAKGLFPRPHPVFRCGKAWRAWYLVSHERDIIEKWRKFSEQTGYVSRIVQQTTGSTLGVHNNRPPLARYVQ